MTENPQTTDRIGAALRHVQAQHGAVGLAAVAAFLCAMGADAALTYGDDDEWGDFEAAPQAPPHPQQQPRQLFASLI